MIESPTPDEIPVGDATGLRKYFKYDIVSGLLVFLIALPLCLGISLASGYPPLAGIFTAIIGAFVTTFLSNSELTIKGPAAGLIVIAIGCIESFGGEGFAKGGGAADMRAYKLALAVGVVAAVGQIILGLLKAGSLGEFFPLSAVHGMLASIGVIIIAKQIPVALGVSAKGEPLVLLKNIPQYIKEANPAIALIGVVSLAILFIWPLFRNRVPALKMIPGQLVVLLVAIPMGMFLDLLHTHSYTLQNHQYQLSDQYLVKMPDRVFGMFDYIAHPDFSAIGTGNFWYWAMMFFLIGSLETLLSAKAVDMIDPWKRKTNLNRDLTAVGVANLGCAFVGGLPMISEIVRSRANIDNGARTRFADMWHGLFLLACVALIPTVLHRIPMAALAAMLIYTGTRLAHYNEFANVFKIGWEQLIVFVATIVGVLATDLLMGIGIGIAVEFAFLLLNGAPLSSLFKAPMDVEDRDASTRVIKVRSVAMFTNWIALRKKIEAEGVSQGKNVTVDLSNTKLVDHSVMEKLHEMERDFKGRGLTLHVTGLDAHRPFSAHALAARKRPAMATS